MPSGTRVSDWCFTGSLDSVPPTVKSSNIYETTRQLGRGSFGDVSLVKNKDDNKLYADKTIFCEKEKHLTETLREVKFLRRNRHPCIIDLHDVYIISNPRVLHIIMPYCETGDLDKMIQKHKKSKSSIPESSIIKWSLQVALALQFLHENGVLHRDLKPQNIMLTEGGELVKVCDFGLALELDKAGESDASAEAGNIYIHIYIHTYIYIYIHT